jgi:hypothetical protein
VGHADVKRLLFTILLLPLLCAAEPGVGIIRAAGHVRFKVNVPPVVRVLQTTPFEGGDDYRVWTNMKSLVINGKEYRFSRVRETTLFVAASKDTFIVHGL